MTILLSPINQKPTEVKCLVLSNTGLLYSGDMSGILVEWEPNFKQTKQKLNYSEIWSLAISPEQKVITARDNNCMIYDMATSDFSKEEFAQTLSVLGNVRGRAPVVVDEKYIACPEFSSGMYINLYANDTKFELKGKLEGGHDYLITALILSGENVVSSGWDEKLVSWNISSKKIEVEIPCESYINILWWMDPVSKQVLAGGKNGYLILAQL